MAKFNLGIDPKAIAKAIYDDETLLFQNYFTTASRSLPEVQLPEIICNNKSFLLNTIDMVTCTPRHFRVNAGSKEPNVRLPITMVDLPDIELDDKMLVQPSCPDTMDFKIENVHLDLSNPWILNEVISIVHLRQIALHMWEENQLCPYFHTIGSLEYIIKALFYKEAIYTGDILVELDGYYGDTNRKGDDSLLHTILLKVHGEFVPVIHISRDVAVTVPQWLQVNYRLEEGTSLSKLASLAMIHSKVVRAFMFNEPLEGPQE